MNSFKTRPREKEVRTFWKGGWTDERKKVLNTSS
jgi:hypothetical protein